MGHIKLFAKNENELDTLTQKIRTYSQDTRLEFGIEKFVKFTKKSG